MSYVAIIGKTPDLSIAELESLFGPENIKPLSKQAVLLSKNVKPETFSKLGGSIKISKILSEIPSTKWPYIHDYIMKNLPILLSQLPTQKFTLGLSVYGLDLSTGKLQATALSAKKMATKSGLKIRIVPNKTLELNSASIIHNKLLEDSGSEIIFVKVPAGKTIIAKTVWTQNIDDYSARDYERPMRDSRVGMLPPKLAQIIINLACGKTAIIPGKTTIYDPFCGTGVLLQEALLINCQVIGTDLEPRMIDYSKKNLDWLYEKFSISSQIVDLYQADATKVKINPLGDYFIACETYLGRPLSVQPLPDVLQKIVQDCDTIHKKFLLNIANQTKTGFRMCIAVPAWYTKKGFIHLPTLDFLSDLGYNRISFKHVAKKDLIYYRQGQQVARELVVLERS